MDFIGTKILGAIKCDQRTVTQAVEGTQAARSFQFAQRRVERRIQQCGFSRVQHRADVVVARDPAQPEQAFAIRPAVAVAQALFNALGRTALLEERLMDAATAISGCGPAYGYLIIEAMSDAGVRLGLPRKTALLLAAQTLLGSAKMVLDNETHPAALKDDVTTPAGCTIDALLVLEDGKLRSTIMRAAIAAAERSATLGRSS